MLKAMVVVAVGWIGAPILISQTTALPAAPAPIPDLLQEASEAYWSGKFDTAVEKYQAALRQNANSAEVYAGLARTYLKQEKVDAAFATAKQGVAELPASLAVHTALGEVYFRQAKMVEAEKEFLVGVNDPHPDARACLGLSRLYDVYSLHARARTMLNRAHELDPRDRDIQRRWMRTLRRQEQIELLEKYLAAPSNDNEDLTRSLHTYLELLRERAKQTRTNCQLVSKVRSTETALTPMLYDPKHLHGFGLVVKVNNQSSRLLLDTGASGLLINKKLAKKAGIEPLVTNQFGGIGDKGDASGFIGYADSIKIGELEFQHCLVEVSDKRSVLDDDGLIGADVFDHYLVTIDFLWQKLKLEELPQRPGEKAATATLASQEPGEADDEAGPGEAPQKASTENQSAEAKTANAKPAEGAGIGPQDRYVAPEMQSYTKIFRFGHDLLIPTRVGTAPPKLFLIDTGAMMNSISPEAAREVTKVHGDDMRVRGLSGSVKNVFSADKAMLEFSHFRQENQDMTAFDLSNVSRNAGTEISGILGFTTLRMFTLKIDYRDGLVDFIYNGPKQ